MSSFDYVGSPARRRTDGYAPYVTSERVNRPWRLFGPLPNTSLRLAPNRVPSRFARFTDEYDEYFLKRRSFDEIEDRVRDAVDATIASERMREIAERLLADAENTVTRELQFADRSWRTRDLEEMRDYLHEVRRQAETRRANRRRILSDRHGLVKVVVPKDVFEGDDFLVDLPNGESRAVRVPPNNKPGDVLTVRY